MRIARTTIRSMTPLDSSSADIPDTASLLAPSYPTRLAQQFFTHSAHAPVTILILEWLLAKSHYFATPDPYVLMLAALVQAAWLAYPGQSLLRWVVLGNLVGVGLYTVVESLLEGWRFFSSAQHQAYWLIAVSFACLQGYRQTLGQRPVIEHAVLLIENIVRAAIPVLLYAVFEARSKNIPLDLANFFADSAHDYLTIVVLLLGILLGFADLTLRRTQKALRVLAEKLHQLSAWGFGANVVAAALQSNEQVALKRQTRSILFMDIRGFTAWSEFQSPESVVIMLNAYYITAEAMLKTFSPIKIKFTADEVMAVIEDPAQALEAAKQLQAAAARILSPYGLRTGVGLHAGPVVEGMLGSASVKAYEVIGDAVNTASRLCSAAAAGELLVSQETLGSAPVVPHSERDIIAKGKREPLRVYVFAE